MLIPLPMTVNPPAGLLNINKPAGLTSHDVVQRVRRILGIKKVGHSGTLDPLATGVLLVAVGQATRLIEYLSPGEKQYRATFVLGVETDTFDRDGEIVATYNPAAITQTELQQTISQFIGDIQQVPPVFSALKKNGVPMYRLARQGKTVEATPRTVHIASIDLLAFEPPLATIDVTCGAGTYIRSLVHDIGRQLGVGAHLTELIRTANGRWQLDTAITLEMLAEAANANRLETVLQPLEAIVAHLPTVRLSPEQIRAVVTGRRVAIPEFLPVPVAAAVDDSGKLVAILAPTEDKQWRPKKVFQTTVPST